MCDGVHRRFPVLFRGRAHLEKRDGITKLIVDGRPFICVAGELANSSSTDTEAMKLAFPRLAKMDLNTVLSVVSWDLIEPEEGKFDFWLVDYQLEAARASHLRLIFLWMASWKNGLSHYEPEWVKTDQARFPRVVDGEGHTLEILSTLSQNNRDADAKAFAALMKHLREVDSKDHTVIGIQVENEMGVLSSSRNFSPAANAAFAGPVPQELTAYLERNKDNLLPELKKIWVAAGSKTSGTWEEVFGKNVPSPTPPRPDDRRPPRAAGVDLCNHADEIFMAWNYARYVGHVAELGKKEYALPFYVNAWLVQPSDRGPGDYPSGGPEPLVHDIWRAGGRPSTSWRPTSTCPSSLRSCRPSPATATRPSPPRPARIGTIAGLPLRNSTRSVSRTLGSIISTTGSLKATMHGPIRFSTGSPARSRRPRAKKDSIRLIALAQGQNPARWNWATTCSISRKSQPGGRPRLRSVLRR